MHIFLRAESIDFNRLSKVSELYKKIKNYMDLGSGWRGQHLHKCVQSDSSWVAASQEQVSHLGGTSQDHCCLSLPGVLAPRSLPAS